MIKHCRLQQGGASLLVLISGVTVSIFIGSLVIMAATQYESLIRTAAREEALSIAEAGIQYYRWHLAHDKNDFTDGTNQPGPYTHDYKDPQGDNVGKFDLNITPPQPGSYVVTIVSTGYTNKYPHIKRTVKARLGIPSLAKYAFLHNSNVFFGAGVTIHGPVMSNGGIRQDGTNDSLMQSALETYTCGKESGCQSPETKSAVWGNGGPQDLWKFPVPPVDFNQVTVSFNTIKADALAIGVYKGPSGALGYHVILKEDQTVDVYKVTKAQSVRGMGPDGKCTNLYENIKDETFVGNYSVNTKHILFFEDNVWVEGTFNGRATIAAARFPANSNNASIWINGSIVYTAKDGSSQLGLISQQNIIFVKDVPDQFEVNAALMAQNGSIFRHSYHVPSCGNNGNSIRTNFTLYGSIISGESAVWNYGTPPGSGFETRILTHDNNLYLNPPPYFPVSRGEDYEFISWSEVSNP